MAFPTGLSQNIFMPPIRAEKTRFAPSPTGFLHRGHVWSALQVWAAARATGAKVHLRIEDHDQSRCRDAHVDAIRADLEWLGFEWDSESRQSQRNEVYQQALEILNAKAKLYYCDCSRLQIAREGSLSPLNSGEIIYSGRCRVKNLPPGNSHALRLFIASPCTVEWNDLRLGTVAQDPTLQCGDPMLMDRLHQWTYQFAVAVDDYDEGIDLIVRGEDIFHSTARQLYISRLLGRTTDPLFLHHSLLTDASGKKLSKREQAASIRSERANSITAQQLLGGVCHDAGLISQPHPICLEEALQLIWQ